MAGRPEKYAAFRTYFETMATKFKNSGLEEFSNTFNELEKMSGGEFPPSAYGNRAWWANDLKRPWRRAKFHTKNVDMKRQTVTFKYSGPFSPEVSARKRAKQKAEKQAELADLRKKLESPLAGFRRKWAQDRFDQISKELNMPTDIAPSAGMADVILPYSGPTKAIPETPPRCRHPLYGAMKGYIQLVAGTDLTEPAAPEWGDRIWGDDTK